MGDTLSRLLIILGSFPRCKSMYYYIALAVSVYITLVCLFDVPRSHVFLQVHQAVHAAAVPTITADGSPVGNMGTGGSFGSLFNAKLDSSQSVVLIVDFQNGPLLASAAPYAFDKRTTGTANESSMCSFDGNEVSSPSTSNIYCRRLVASPTFLVFKYSDLSPVQDGSNNDPLYVAAGTNLGDRGMVTVVGSFLFVTSELTDATLYRIDLSTLTYTGTVNSTRSAQDTSAATENYRYGACDSNGFCYAFSYNKRLAKFTQDNTSGSPTYVSTLDLSQSGQLDSGAVNANCNDVVLDSFGNNLLVATTQTAFIIAKIDLGTFTFVSRVTLTGGSLMYLCENCLTAGSETYMMVISYNSAKDARFIKLGDMTEVTAAGSFVDSGGFARAAWLTTTPGAEHGGIVNSVDAVIKLITTGVVPAITTTSTRSVSASITETLTESFSTTVTNESRTQSRTVTHTHTRSGSVTAIDVNTTTTTAPATTNASTTTSNNTVSSNITTASPSTNSTLGSSTSSTTSTTTTVTSTTTQTSAAPVTAVTYAPLPSNLNDTVIVKNEANVAPDSPLKDVDAADSLDDIARVLERINTRSKQTDAAGATLSAPVSTTTSFFVPYQGLGQFIIKPTAECKFSPNLDFRIDVTGTKVDTLPSGSGTSADVEAAVKDCVVFNPSPETIARNISKQKFLGVTVQSGSEEATTALALESVKFNTGPDYSFASSNCTTTVPRGSGFAARFTRNLGYVFVHPLGLPMTITSTGADLFPLPRAVKTSPNASGFITVRGNIESSNPLDILFTASDGFTEPVQATCSIVPVFIDLHVKNQMTTPTDVHVGSSFTFFIPNDMFESSSEFRIEYVVQENRLPLPNGISFQRPNLVTGRLPGVGLFRFLVVAADELREVQGYILINGTNRAPVPTFNNNVSDIYPLGRAFAARAMNKEINLAPIFSDPDDDALRYFMNTTQLAAIPWLRVEVSPGGYTKSPQNLIISGNVPREARGTNYTLQLSCTDNYNTTTIETKLSIAQGEAPIQIKDLPVYTVAPKEVLAEQIQIGEYFISPEGDQMLVGYVIRPVVTWVTINNNPGTAGAPPTLAITASREEIEDTKVDIHVTVSNALGDSVNATSTINVVRTDWQKIRQVGTILAAALGVITSILGTVVYYPHIVNAALGRRLVKKCPLHHTTPRFKFPDKTVRFECSIRSKFEICGSDLFKIFDFFNHYLYNRMTLKPTPNGRPPVWLNVQDRRMVLVLPPPPDDHVGIKTVICRFWRKSNFLAEEFEAVYDECYNGYVYDEAQVEKNAAFTGERERGRATSKLEDFDDFDDFDEEMSPRNNNNNKSSSLAPVAAAASTAAAVTIPDSFKKKQQALEFELSETKASTNREIQHMKRIINELLGDRKSQGFQPQVSSATFNQAAINSSSSSGSRSRPAAIRPDLYDDTDL